MSDTATLERPVKPFTKRKGTALRVKGHGPGFIFGCEPHGKVLPIWVAEKCGRSAEQLVADGDMEWTDDEPVGEWQAPKPKKEEESSSLDALSEENDRLRRRNFELTGLNRQLEGESGDLKRSKELQLTQLGEQAGEIAHWRTTSEGYRIQVETLTADAEEREKTLESLTAKNKELEERLAAILKVQAPGSKDKTKAKDAPTG